MDVKRDVKTKVAGSLRTLAAALRSHGKEQGLDLDGLYAEAGGKAMSEADFVAYLEKLPEAVTPCCACQWPLPRLGTRFRCATV